MTLQTDGKIIDKQRIPSPHPRVYLYCVTYRSQGLKVKGYLAEPLGARNLPGFLYLRGGIKNVGMVRVARIIQFAAEGFIVMAPFYRGNRGGEGREDFGGEDRYDAFFAYEVLQNHPNVDPNQIHVFGFSRGGMMALLTGIHQPDVRSIVSWGGVTDLVLTYEERVDLRKMLKRVIGGTPSKFIERYQWRTPLFELNRIKSPVLIIHGKKDKNVSVDHAVGLKEKLIELGKPVTSWIFDNYDHIFPAKVDRKVIIELCQWMKKQI